MIDVIEQINSVQRLLGNRVLTAGEARSLIISRTYDTDIDEVWDACTNPERIPRWFLPVSGELRPGGHYQLEGNAGGTIERCDPPNGFFATWEYGGTVSWIELRLTAMPAGGTRFELEHVTPVDEHWAQFGPGAVGIGWDLSVMGLTRHLSTGAAADPEQSALWMASAPGKQFLSLSSQRWCEASIAAGADEAEATAAAGRATAAYAGTPA